MAYRDYMGTERFLIELTSDFAQLSGHLGRRLLTFIKLLAMRVQLSLGVQESGSNDGRIAVGVWLSFPRMARTYARPAV